ncbi:MAG: SDR family NAD(P)-dependent oxidoreductase, partial [Alphaproteobacteria bacterium]
MTKTETALIVGAGPGLGGAIARRCAKEGMTVAVSSRNKAKIEGVARTVGARAFACDATDPAAVAALFENVKAT